MEDYQLISRDSLNHEDESLSSEFAISYKEKKNVLFIKRFKENP